MLIGLTGGIGCGKSTVAAEFGAAGFAVIDVDRIVREEVLRDGTVIEAARTRWGDEVVDAAGQLDRGRIAERVFAAAEERRWWEGVVHPRVGACWRAQVAARPDARWVVEIPLLFEAGLEKGFDFIVCVGANPTVQIARTVARGLSAAQAERRIAAQFPLDHKIKQSHAVIWNDGSREFLRAQVVWLARRLVASSAG